MAAWIQDDDETWTTTSIGRSGIVQRPGTVAANLTAVGEDIVFGARHVGYRDFNPGIVYVTAAEEATAYEDMTQGGNPAGYLDDLDEWGWAVSFDAAPLAESFFGEPSGRWIGAYRYSAYVVPEYVRPFTPADIPANATGYQIHPDDPAYGTPLTRDLYIVNPYHPSFITLSEDQTEGGTLDTSAPPETDTEVRLLAASEYERATVAESASTYKLTDPDDLLDRYDTAALSLGTIPTPAPGGTAPSLNHVGSLDAYADTTWRQVETLSPGAEGGTISVRRRFAVAPTAAAIGPTPTGAWTWLVDGSTMRHKAHAAPTAPYIETLWRPPRYRFLFGEAPPCHLYPGRGDGHGLGGGVTVWPPPTSHQRSNHRGASSYY